MTPRHASMTSKGRDRAYWALVLLLCVVVAALAGASPALGSFTIKAAGQGNTTITLASTGAPSAPTGLSCRWTAAATVGLSWTAGTSYAGTQILRSDNGAAYSAISGSTYASGTTAASDASASTPASHTYAYKGRGAVGSAPWVSGDSSIVTSTGSGSGLVSSQSSYCRDGIGQLVSGAANSKLSNPTDVAVNSSGDVFIADTSNHEIRMIYNGGPYSYGANSGSPVVGYIYTIAGTGGTGSTGDGGPATSAKLAQPRGLALDSSGNIFIADSANHALRWIPSTTCSSSCTAKFGFTTWTANNMYTIAGVLGSSGNGTYDGSVVAGPGSVAATPQKLNSPHDIAVDSAGNAYTTDQQNFRVVKVLTSDDKGNRIAGTGVSGFSGNGGAATSAQIAATEGIAIDTHDDVFFADKGNQEIRCIAAAAVAGYCNQSSAPTVGRIYNVAGDTLGSSGNGGDNVAAVASTAKLNTPWGIALDSNNNLLIGDSANNLVKIVFATASGNQYGASGHTQYNMYYVAGVASGAPYTGNGYPALGTGAGNAGVPEGVAFSGANVYFLENSHNLLRFVDTSANLVFTWAGQQTAGATGDGAAAHAWDLDTIVHTAVDSSGNVYMPDFVDKRVREFVVSSGYVKTVAGNGGSSENNGSNNSLSAGTNAPNGVALDSTAANLYIADQTGQRVQKVVLSTMTMSPAVGGGGSCTTSCGSNGDAATAATVKFDAPSDVAVDSFGNIFVADNANCTIRVVAGRTATQFNISMTSGGIYLIGGTYETTCSSSGDGGAGTSAHILNPDGIAVDGSGNVYIAEAGGYKVRCIAITATAGNCGQGSPSAGFIYNIAGTGSVGDAGSAVTASSSTIGHPLDVAYDTSTSSIYIADTTYSKIRCVAFSTNAACGKTSGSPATAGIMYTVAGGGSNGVGGWGPDASLQTPKGVSVLGAGGVFISQSTTNQDVRILVGPDP